MPLYKTVAQDFDAVLPLCRITIAQDFDAVLPLYKTFAQDFDAVCLYVKQILHNILMLFCLYAKQILHKILMLFSLYGIFRGRYQMNSQISRFARDLNNTVSICYRLNLEAWLK